MSNGRAGDPMDVRLPEGVRPLLRCPWCGSEVDDTPGGFACPRGHRLFADAGVIEALVPSDDEDSKRTMESFGYEWTVFDRIQPEDEGYWRWYVQDLPLDELAGCVALDAGCGKGRYTGFTAGVVKAMVALEPSDAVIAAARNLGALPNVAVVRADLHHAPFAPQSFGLVSCLGVLHHLADPEGGFRRLVGLLAPDGRMLLYLYSRPVSRGVRSVGLWASSALRRLTVRVPHPVLRPVSAVMAVLLWLGLVLPGWIGERLDAARLRRLPLQTYRGRPWRVLWLDTFDRLSAPLENRYVWEDLAPWFERAGLVVESAREDAGWFIVLRKPSGGQE